MTIPGRGDLSPRRKHRNWRRRFVVLLVVVAVAGGGYAGYHFIGGDSAGPVATLVPCPAGRPMAPVAEREPLTVRNATLTTGLAARVARELRQRGFRIASIGNTLFRGSGVAIVRYSADRAESARLVAAQFAGATTAEVSGTGVLEVDMGPQFSGLVPASQAAAADRAILAMASPSPTPTPTPTCTPTARSTSTP